MRINEQICQTDGISNHVNEIMMIYKLAYINTFMNFTFVVKRSQFDCRLSKRFVTF